MVVSQGAAAKREIVGVCCYRSCILCERTLIRGETYRDRVLHAPCSPSSRLVARKQYRSRNEESQVGSGRNELSRKGSGSEDSYS